MLKVTLDGQTYTCHDLGTAFNYLGGIVSLYSPPFLKPREIQVQVPKTFKVEWAEEHAPEMVRKPDMEA